MGMERRGKIVKIKGNPVGFMTCGRSSHDSGELCSQSCKLKVLRIEQVQIGLSCNTRLGDLALQRCDPGMGILHVKDRIVL